MSVFVYLLASYKYDIAEWLISEKKTDKVYIPYMPSFNQEKEECQLIDQIEFVPIDKLMKREYREHVDVSRMPPLSRSFLDDAIKYESMFIRIASFRGAMPAKLVNDARREYLFFMRYWNDFLIKNDVKYIVFDDQPHWMASYSLYATARVLGIRTNILAPIGVRDPRINGYLHVWGETIETVGTEIEKAYLKIKNVDSSELELEGLAKLYFEKSINRKNEAALAPKDRKKWLKYVRNAKYKGSVVYFPPAKVFFHNLFYLASALLKYRDIRRYYEKRYTRADVRDLWRESLYFKYDLMTLKKYDKNAVYPDYDEKFILFTPQLWPEASTMPQAGHYSEQFNTIQLLAYITKEYGIKIYVKEYYLQPYREKKFWDEIKGLDNVKLIKSDVSSGELMERAMAVACQTGTSLIEAPFYGIPAITVGGGFCLHGMPGVYEVDDAIQGKMVVEEIINGIEIKQDDIKKYFYALQQNSVIYYRAPDGHVDAISEEYKRTVDSLIRMLERVI